MQGQKWWCDTLSLQGARVFPSSPYTDLQDEHQIMSSCQWWTFKEHNAFKTGRWNLSVLKSIAAWRESEYLPEQRETIHRNNRVVLSKADYWKQIKKENDLTLNPNLLDKTNNPPALFLHNCPVITKKFKIFPRIRYRCRQAAYGCRFQLQPIYSAFSQRKRRMAVTNWSGFWVSVPKGDCGCGRWLQQNQKHLIFFWELRVNSRRLWFKLDFGPCSLQNSLNLNWKCHTETITKRY